MNITITKIVALAKTYKHLLTTKTAAVVIAVLSVLGYGALVIAAPLYNPGQTLSPTCDPSNPNCTVFPMAIGAGVALATPGSIPFIDANGALQQDNANLKWDNALKRLTLSQGLTLGSVNVVNTVSVGSSPQATAISGNYAYVANSNSDNVSIIDISTPASASVVATVSVGIRPRAITISGNYAYVANNGSDNVSIIDISTPASASVVTTVSVGIRPRAITISGNYAYVANDISGNVSIIDISTPASASVVTTVSVGSSPQATAISGNYAYVANNGSGNVSIIDISTPASASVVTTVSVGSYPQAITISGNYAYVANNGSDSVSIIDISTPASASVVTTVSVGSYPQAITISGNYAYVANSNSDNVSIIDISTPASASVVTTVSVGSYPQAITISGNYAYVANDSSGNVSIIDISTVSSVLPPSSVVALSVDGTIQSSILSGSGVVNLTADNNGNIIPTFSDQSLKTNVTSISSALDKIKHLQGKYYNWKDAERFGAQREMGFIAQEVEPIVPEVVRSVGSFKTLNYANLVALQNEGIKELDIRLATIESIAGINEESATSSLMARFSAFLASTAKKVVGGILEVKGKLFANEIIIKDQSTGNPYCVTIVNGVLVAQPGESCNALMNTTPVGSSTGTAGTGTAPELVPDTTIPVVISTTTSTTTGGVINENTSSSASSTPTTATTTIETIIPTVTTTTAPIVAPLTSATTTTGQSSVDTGATSASSTTE